MVQTHIFKMDGFLTNTGVTNRYEKLFSKYDTRNLELVQTMIEYDIERSSKFGDGAFNFCIGGIAITVIGCIICGLYHIKSIEVLKYILMSLSYIIGAIILTFIILSTQDRRHNKLNADLTLIKQRITIRKK